MSESDFLKGGPLMFREPETGIVVFFEEFRSGWLRWRAYYEIYEDRPDEGLYFVDDQRRCKLWSGEDHHICVGALKWDGTMDFLMVGDDDADPHDWNHGVKMEDIRFGIEYLDALDAMWRLVFTNAHLIPGWPEDEQAMVEKRWPKEAA